MSNHFITLFSFRKELIQKLVEEGHDVYLSLPEDQDDYFANLGCHIILTDVDRRGVNPKNDLKLIFFYKKMIPEVNPDIVFHIRLNPIFMGHLQQTGNINKYVILPEQEEHF
ncbi:MAG: glycosyltransferase [Mediterraneibacter gnavus]